ncbi:hypothetical protein [Falsiroseomonas sp. CW058]|uniref:hypothetical protein n=1 Tax=Falsiroseomonas sp. CW058 TaxID=3388664 RepID=UPI003D31DD1D
MPVTRFDIGFETGPGIAGGVPGRGGRNHAGAAAATAPALRAALLGLVLAASGLGPVFVPAPAAAQTAPEENPLVQRNVPAEATAENAVVARDRALAAGQRLAYERMAGQLGLSTGASDSQIESMVQSLVIESERITPRGYAARITVNFNPSRVGARAPSGSAAAAAPSPAAQPGRGGPAVTTVDAVARYRSFPEWVEITRRLGSAGPVARVEVVTVSGDMARLRLALRSQPPEAAAELGAAGLQLNPGPIDARPGEGWRLSLAGGR